MNKMVYNQSMLARKFTMIGADNSRIDIFCQFKKEVRGSSEYMIVGIDIAKKKNHAFFGTANVKSILKRLVFDNNQDICWVFWVHHTKLLAREKQNDQNTHEINSQNSCAGFPAT
jgi:hypothetical protein